MAYQGPPGQPPNYGPPGYTPPPGYSLPPGYPPPRPPRKSNALLILVTIGAAVLVLFGGCTVLAIAVGSHAPRTVTASPAAVAASRQAVQPSSVAAEPSQTATTITVPDVRGLDGATARKRLTAAGLYVVTFQAVTGKTVIMASLWRVVDQTPAAGSQTRSSDAVTLKVDRFPVSSQPEPTNSTSPETREPARSQTNPTSKPEPTRTREREPEPTQDLKSEPPPQTAQPETDQRYRTCGEANDHGLGPYVRGKDPEYDWYQDRDGDGIVCEP